jgi:hypothetical protein
MTVVSSKDPPTATSRVLLKDQVLLCRAKKVILQEVLAVEIITTAANCESLHTTMNKMTNLTQRLDMKMSERSKGGNGTSRYVETGLTWFM